MTTKASQKAARDRGNDLRAMMDGLPRVRRLSREQRDHVRRVVAAHSRDAEDCRLLLQQLGLPLGGA